MARPQLGTKRLDPVTGKKFYDLNKDPIVSPYTGQSYPISAFETPAATSSRASRAAPAAVVAEEPEVETAELADVELVSLEDAEADASPAVETGTEDVDIEEDLDEAEPFLEEEEEEGEDDVADLLGGDIEEDEET